MLTFAKIVKKGRAYLTKQFDLFWRSLFIVRHLYAGDIFQRPDLFLGREYLLHVLLTLALVVRTHFAAVRFRQVSRTQRLERSSQFIFIVGV